MPATLDPQAVFGRRLASGVAPAVLQSDETVVVDDVPLFSEIRASDPSVEDGTRTERGKEWLERAVEKTRSRISLGKRPIMTLRHIFDDPERVGVYEPTRVDLAEVNPGEDPRWTIFGKKIYESREAFEKAKGYDFRSIEISPDAPDELAALALLRSKEPFHKYPSLLERLEPKVAEAFQVEAFRARRGVAPQVWRNCFEQFENPNQPRNTDGEWSKGGGGGSSGGVGKEAKSRPTDKLAAKVGLWRAAEKAGVPVGDYLKKNGLTSKTFYKSDLANKLSSATLDEHESSEGEFESRFHEAFMGVAATATNFAGAQSPYTVANAMLNKGQITKAQFDDVVSAIKRESHEAYSDTTKEGSMPGTDTKTDEKKQPSIEERMEAAMSKGFEAMAAKFEAMVAKAIGGGSKKGSSEAAEDAEDAEDSEESEAAEDAEEAAATAPKKGASEAAQATGPNAALPPAVSQLRPGETFAAQPGNGTHATITHQEKLELLGLRSWAKKKENEEKVESYAQEGEKALATAGVTLDAEIRTMLRASAKDLGKAGVDHAVATITHFAKNAARAPEAYGLASQFGDRGPGGQTEDLKKAVETFGARPDVKAKIHEFYASYQSMPEHFRRSATFMEICNGHPEINPACLDARGGLTRKG